MAPIRPVPFPDPSVNGPDTIGKAIRAARTQAGLKVVDAAMLTGVAIQTLVDIEAGRPGVGLGKVLQVADGLGVSLFAVPVSVRALVRHQLAQLLASGK
jgi:transcriptional regulator with XRE-family HTH domain